MYLTVGLVLDHGVHTHQVYLDLLNKALLSSYFSCDVKCFSAENQKVDMHDQDSGRQSFDKR